MHGDRREVPGLTGARSNPCYRGAPCHRIPVIVRLNPLSFRVHRGNEQGFPPTTEDWCHPIGYSGHVRDTLCCGRRLSLPIIVSTCVERTDEQFVLSSIV